MKIFTPRAKKIIEQASEAARTIRIRYYFTVTASLLQILSTLLFLIALLMHSFVLLKCAYLTVSLAAVVAWFLLSDSTSKEIEKFESKYKLSRKSNSDAIKILQKEHDRVLQELNLIREGRCCELVLSPQESFEKTLAVIKTSRQME